MRTLINILIILILTCCSGKLKKYNELTDIDYKHESDTVNNDTFYFKTAITENEPQEFRELVQSDEEFLKKCREFADSLIKTYSPGYSIKNYTPEVLDNLIDLYNTNNIKCSQNAFVNSIGVAMGDYLVEKLGMTWTVVEDAYGIDYGVTIKNIKLTNFPLNSVLKDIEQKCDGSLQSIFLMTLKNKSELIKEQ
jgi:hypothetical protein